MTLTHRRAIKNIIANIIAYTLSIILLAIMILAGIKIATLIVTTLTFKEVRQVIWLIGPIAFVIMLYREFKKE